MKKYAYSLVVATVLFQFSLSSVASQTLSSGVITPTPEPSPTAVPSPTPSLSPTPNPEVTSVEIQEVTGEVLRTEQNQITLQTSNGTTVASVPDSVQITRNGSEVAISEIKPGDTVQLLQTNAGEVLAVAAESGQVGNISRNDTNVWWWIIASVPVLALIYYLIQRSKKGHIRSGNKMRE